MRRPLWVIVGLVLLLGGLGGGFALGRAGRVGKPADAARPAAFRPTGLAVAWTPREGERPLTVAPILDDNLQLQPLGITCHLTAVFGTHAEAPPTGQFCRLALAVANHDLEYHTWEASGQTLVDATGKQYPPAGDPMAIKRQPTEVKMGGRLTLWIDCWYDVPRDAKITGVRLRGDRDPSGYYALKPGPFAPAGNLVPLPAV
jgi:hypothetical protein